MFRIKMIINIVVLLCLPFSLFAQSQQQILDTIRNIDNNMSKGEIVFFVNGVQKNKITYEYNKYVSEVTNGNNSYNITSYSDGKNYFSFSKNDVIIEDKETRSYNVDNCAISGISAKASWGEGRGLSALSDLSIEEKNGKKILVGYLHDKTKIIAELEPQYDFLASKIDRYRKNGNIGATWICSNPKKIDGIYIATMSTYVVKLPHYTNNKKVEILEASFKKPAESKLKLDWLSKDLIHDARFGQSNLITFLRKDLPSDVTLDKLFELSKKELEDKSKIAKKIKDENRTKKIGVILASLLLILLMFLIIKKSYKSRQNKL